MAQLYGCKALSNNASKRLTENGMNKRKTFVLK